MTTASTASSSGAVVGQSMPAFVPPANIGSGQVASNGSNFPTMIDRTTAQPAGVQSATVSQDLPALQPSSVTSTQAMPAQTAVASSPSMQAPISAPAQSAPQLSVAADNTYSHTIASGESLYTIARRYDVSATDIISANNIGAPDSIRVGQKLVIPGRPDLLQQRAQQNTQVAANTSATASGSLSAPTQSAPAVADVRPTPTEQPTQVASAPADQVAAAPQPAAASDKFRWPLSGRVITDFAASRGTGINIEAPEGTSVRAAENGEVIYVGNAVEGYGNLILVKHNNGFVSAYAHLNTIGVVKGDSVSRGDAIGTVGMSGSVTRPQLHFELRRGATPVDPMPHLAG